MELTRVDRPQPVMPERGFEQQTKAFDGVDAGVGDERHGECTRRCTMARWGKGRAGENACVATGGGAKTNAVRLQLLGPRSFPGERGRLF